MRRPRIIVIGSSNTDMTIATDHLPERGETVTEGRYYESGGGKGANQAVAASRAGGEVDFIGRVGDDRFGRAAIDRLEGYGVSTDGVTVDEEVPSGIALIMVDSDGENMISVAPGANRELTPDHVKEVSPMIRKGDVLLIQMEVPLAVVNAALSLGRENDVMTVLDPAPVPAEPLPPQLLGKVSLLTPNLAEAAKLAGLRAYCKPASAASALRAQGVDAVAVTLGADGVFLSCENVSCHLSGAHANSVDAVGAGDCFAAVMSVALGEGRGWIDAARMAMCAAALSTETTGAQESMPERERILRRVQGYESQDS